MIILGIDPGTITLGYGLVKSEDSEISLVGYGTINALPRSSIGERLSYIYNKLLEIVSRYQPDVMAVEQPFIAKNVKSAFAIGRAQAVAILVAANKGTPIYEYTPAQIKQRVTSYGASSKEQIQEMVKLQLELTDIPEPSDAADALAVALCYISETHLDRLLSK